MASGEQSVIPEADDLGQSSVELITIDDMEENGSVQQHPATDDTPNISYTTIPVEVLEAAGIDIENSGELTEEHMSTIMSLMGPNTVQSELKQHEQNAALQSSYSGDVPGVSSAETNDRLTLYVLDDGSLKLVDAALQKEFFFTSQQLIMQNIDVDNLTDESLQRIIQMAMESYDIIFSKKLKADEAHSSVEPSKSSYSPGPSIELPAYINQKKMNTIDERRVKSELIGTNVEIKRDGKVFSATIRYCRQSGGYKVQFSDGHFEWVDEDEIQLIENENMKKRGDYDSYNHNPTLENVAAESFSGIYSSQKCATQVPGIKVTPLNGCFKKEEPNFCCLVCDRKVYQKEPQYIVIRIPACDKCAEQKMIVLEGTTKDREVQTCSSEEENKKAVKLNQ